MIGFCHTYKTAGTSFNSILRKHYGWRHFDNPGFEHQMLSAKDLKRLRLIYPCLESICGHTIRPYSDLQDAEPNLRFYTFLRDPVKRSISHFTWFLRWKAHDGIFFDNFDTLLKEWAKADVNRNKQCQHLSKDADWKSVKAMAAQQPFLFLRVKHFDKSLFLFRQWAEEPEMDLSYTLRNTGGDRYERLQSSHPDYLEKVRTFQKALKKNEIYQKLLLEANQQDQNLIEWVDAEIWPKQLEAYPGNLSEEVEEFQKTKQDKSTTVKEPLFAKMHRNMVLKPLRPLLIPADELPASVKENPWL